MKYSVYFQWMYKLILYETVSNYCNILNYSRYDNTYLSIYCWLYLYIFLWFAQMNIYNILYFLWVYNNNWELYNERCCHQGYGHEKLFPCRKWLSANREEQYTDREKFRTIFHSASSLHCQWIFTCKTNNWNFIRSIYYEAEE